MIYIGYFVSVAVAVFLAITAARYANILDRTTNLSGAFIGVVILAVVTSLPEFFTSMSAITVFNIPDFPAGNVLGSNIFNISIISFAILFYRRKFTKHRLSKIYSRIAVLVLIMYIMTGFVFGNIISLRVAHFSIISPLILVVYAIGMRYVYVATDTIADEAALRYSASVETKLTGKQTAVRLGITAILLVIVSGFVTYTAEKITLSWGIEGGFGGAIFLGIATSVPELASFITLFRVRNYDIAVGSMIGSNMFNFTILAITDIFSSGNMYLAGQAKSPVMVMTGLLTTAIFLFMLLERQDNKKVEVVCPALILASYAAFLLL